MAALQSTSTSAQALQSSAPSLPPVLAGLHASAFTIMPRRAFYRIPPEIWIMVLTCLKLWDRVRAARVSRAMRRLALGTTRLWAHICIGGYGQEELEDYSYAPHTVSSLEVARKLAARAKDQALVAEVDLTGITRPRYDDILWLQQATSLVVVSNDTEMLTNARLFDVPFSRLRTLSIERQGYLPGPEGMIWMSDIFHTIRTPELLQLRTYVEVTWHGVAPGMFPALQSLTLHITSVSDVIYALIACPALSALNVTVQKELKQVDKAFITSQLTAIAQQLNSITISRSYSSEVGEECDSGRGSLFQVLDICTPRKAVQITCNSVWPKLAKMMANYRCHRGWSVSTTSGIKQDIFCLEDPSSNYRYSIKTTSWDECPAAREFLLSIGNNTAHNHINRMTGGLYYVL